MAFWNKKKVETLHIDIDLHVIPPQDFYDKLKECLHSFDRRTPIIEGETTSIKHTPKRQERRSVNVADGIDMVVFKYTSSKNSGIYFSSATGRYLLGNGWKYVTIQETAVGGAIVLNKKRLANSFELRADYQNGETPRKAICYSPMAVKKIEQCLGTPFKETTTHVHLGKNISRNGEALRFRMSTT